MSDDQLFIVVEGVGPADFPENEASSNKQDGAVALANDIHDLIREEYEGDSMRIQLKPLEHEVCHGVTLLGGYAQVPWR